MASDSEGEVDYLDGLLHIDDGNVDYVGPLADVVDDFGVGVAIVAAHDVYRDAIIPYEHVKPPIWPKRIHRTQADHHGICAKMREALVTKKNAQAQAEKERREKDSRRPPLIKFVLAKRR